MSFIRNNIWGIGFVVLFIGALVAMWAAGKSSQFPNPTDTAESTVEFSIGPNDNVKGAQNGSVTIVEFSDYQCPACKSYAPILDEIVKQYPNDVRLVYKHFPLRSIHPRADAGARAAEAAGLQGKFWEMTALLFRDQDVWTRQAGNSAFEQYATELNLDVTKFNTDIGSEAVKAAVEEDVKLGQSLNITGTPTLYVNGKRVQNPRSFEEFMAYIQTEVSMSKSNAQ